MITQAFRYIGFNIRGATGHQSHIQSSPYTFDNKVAENKWSTLLLCFEILTTDEASSRPSKSDKRITGPGVHSISNRLFKTGPKI